jgi:hypothetical protein
MQKLTVHELPVEDCWRDMARIQKHYRKDETGDHIARNTICEITINGHTKLLALRGNRDKQPHILLDSTTRHELDVESGCTYDVEIHKVSWLSYWKWAWGAADPGYRLAMQISLISFALGLIGLILGVLPLVTHH